MKKIFLVSLLLVVSTSSFAQSLFEGVMVRGNGCAQGKATIVMAPDQKSFSILFDEFSTGLPKTSVANDNQEAVKLGILPSSFASSKQVEMKMCTISFNLNLPGRTRSHEMEVSYDYRGHLYLDRQLAAFFKSLMFQVANNPHAGNAGGQSHSHTLVQNDVFSAQANDLDQDLTISNVRRVRFNSVPRIKAVNGQQVYINQVFMGFKNVIGVHALNPNLNSNLTGLMVIDSTDMVGKMTVKMVSSI